MQGASGTHPQRRHLRLSRLLRCQQLGRSARVQALDRRAVPRVRIRQRISRLHRLARERTLQLGLALLEPRDIAAELVTVACEGFVLTRELVELYGMPRLVRL